MIFLKLTLITACILTIGLILEEIILYLQKKRLTYPGHLIKTSNGNIHVVSKGDGDTTIVFASSLGITSPYCDFFSLQDKISNFSKTALYEKYGYGFSPDIYTNVSLDNLVHDIRFSLKECGHTPPYIFLCHSMASVEILRYAELFPSEVKGIIMDDAFNPEFKDKLKLPSIAHIRIATFFKYTGFYRLVTKFPYIKKKTIGNIPSKDLRHLKSRLHVRNYYNEYMIKELKQFSANCSLILRNGINLKNIPLYIITAGNRKAFSKDFNKAWFQSQEEMLSWSKKSSQVVVKNADHFIHYYDEEILINAVKEIIKA
ncbi:alpha/beta hydrolase [Clostridium sp. SHJSY1]|uniref:alpha/beta hydrolase n=1 Tax=Clostridium sp. SHJSY1 TaxID=2942483 RepID=UPI0028748899|nr:alpha/beta hydrolase [Clostridium sp. SHJSY1]MDS0525543.1 alpha/beta hydrolase [Clostridium sp. SHJSY1]